MHRLIPTWNSGINQLSLDVEMASTLIIRVNEHIKPQNRDQGLYGDGDSPTRGTPNQIPTGKYSSLLRSAIFKSALVPLRD